MILGCPGFSYANDPRYLSSPIPHGDQCNYYEETKKQRASPTICQCDGGSNLRQNEQLHPCCEPTEHRLLGSVYPDFNGEQQITFEQYEAMKQRNLEKYQNIEPQLCPQPGVSMQNPWQGSPQKQNLCGECVKGVHTIATNAPFQQFQQSQMEYRQPTEQYQQSSQQYQHSSEYQQSRQQYQSPQLYQQQSPCLESPPGICKTADTTISYQPPRQYQQSCKEYQQTQQQFRKTPPQYQQQKPCLECPPGICEASLINNQQSPQENQRPPKDNQQQKPCLECPPGICKTPPNINQQLSQQNKRSPRDHLQKPCPEFPPRVCKTPPNINQYQQSQQNQWSCKDNQQYQQQYPQFQEQVHYPQFQQEEQYQQSSQQYCPNPRYEQFPEALRYQHSLGPQNVQQEVTRIPGMCPNYTCRMNGDIPQRKFDECYPASNFPTNQHIHNQYRQFPSKYMCVEEADCQKNWKSLLDEELFGTDNIDFRIGPQFETEDIEVETLQDAFVQKPSNNERIQNQLDQQIRGCYPSPTSRIISKETGNDLFGR